jgi:hypothetical protein
LATGGLLVCLALLTLAAVTPIFCGSDPPRWTTRDWGVQCVTLAIVCAFAMGIGYLGAGSIAALQTGPDYIDLALLAGVVLVAAVIWRGLKARGRSRALAAAAAGHAFGPASGDARSGGLARAGSGPARASRGAPPHRMA